LADFLARKNFWEMEYLEGLINDFQGMAVVKIVDYVSYKERKYPLYCLVLGSRQPEDPSVGFFGGVHGLEKIGSEVVMSYLTTVLELLRWDKSFQKRLESSTMVFMPIVNPVGIVMRSRSNGNGVDLMRNSPLNSDSSRIPLVSGHTLSSKLPWYRGNYEGAMETEAKAMLQVVEEYLLGAKISIAIDVHSGFGARDRLWFPYAHSKKPFPYLPEVFAMNELLDMTYPNHVYEVEPVSRQYTIEGDLWDYLFLENLAREDHNFFIPFTLEMGSWNWLRKNPFQIFDPLGAFHPMKPHRRSRTLRRHLYLFDFLHRAIVSPAAWYELEDKDREIKRRKALDLWYG
jgi:hypothetical protein